MNIQAMMKQAQTLQKNMMKEKEEIDKTIFVGKSSFVTVEVTGDKKIKNVKIDTLDDDIEMLQDMVMIAVNNAMNEIDKVTEEKMGKYTQGMPGLF